MTPAALHALASRVETEEPTDELRALVLAAFGSEADPGSAPDPLRSVDDALAWVPHGWCVSHLSNALGPWVCIVYIPGKRKGAAQTATAARAITAAALRALAWEKEHTA